MKILLRLSILSLCLTTCLTVFSQVIKGNYAIKNLETGLLLRPLEASNKNETPIVGYSPTNWKCMTWNFMQVSGNTYCLKNLLTHKTFQPAAAATDGITLKQEPLVTENQQQQWEFIPAEKGTYLIRLKETELYLTAVKNDINSNITLAAKKNNKTQYWTIYEQDPQY